MKIAMMVRGYLRAPAPSDIIYAPIELAIDISEGLVKRGHSVDFYGPSGTRLNVPVKTRGLPALAHNRKEFQALLNSVDLLTHYVPSLWDQYLASEMFRLAAKGTYDLLHFHHLETAMPYANLFPQVPVAYTIHDPIRGWYHDIFKMYHSPNQRYISISNNQRLPEPSLPYAATVYNGIDAQELPFSTKPDDYLLFVGRIVPEKGVHEAIQVARRTNHRLLIAGPVYTDQQVYFNKCVKPYLNDRIQHLGFVDHPRIFDYFAKAKALLMPIKWEEPFGLTMIEAMACGTPVIAFHRGSVPEIVQDGKTGFIVKNLREMTEAVGKINTLRRRDCRQHVETNFSIERMVKGYEQAFMNILADHRAASKASV